MFARAGSIAPPVGAAEIFVGRSCTFMCELEACAALVSIVISEALPLEFRRKTLSTSEENRTSQAHEEDNMRRQGCTIIFSLFEGFGVHG